MIKKTSLKQRIKIVPLVALCGLIVLIFLIKVVGLNKTQKIFSIVSSVSLVFAFLTYLYKKKQDETLATIEQITFFREKIIYKWDEVSKKIKLQNPNYWFSCIKLDNSDYSIDVIKKSFSENFNNQLSLFFNSETLKIHQILDEQIFLLNMLEEFALKVKLFKTQNNPALSSVQKTFVDLVEKNAVAIFFVRDIMFNNPLYSEVLELYSNWVNKINRSNFFNNLEKHGFITKEKKKEILKKQRENRSIGETS